MGLKERFSEIIIEIQKDWGVSNVKLAEMLGCNKNTINNYKLKRTSPHKYMIDNLCATFKANPEWIYHGQGEAFPEDAETGTVNQPAPIYKVAPETEFKISEALTMVKDIHAYATQHGTYHADALYRDILHHKQAVREDATIKLKDQLAKAQKLLEEKAKKMEAVIKENEDLKTRLDEKKNPSAHQEAVVKL